MTKEDLIYPKDFEEINRASHEQLAKWYRFLYSPKTTLETNLMNRILKLFNQKGGMTPEISKKIGF